MDLYIDRDELIRGLSRVQGIAERRPTTQVLSHVLLSASQDRVRLTATDTTLTLVADYVARVEREGDLSVDAQAFFQIARSLPGPTVRLTAEANNRLAIRSDRASFHLVGLTADDFPAIPTRDDRTQLDVSGGGLRRIIDETLFSVSADDNRYGLNGAHLEEVAPGDGPARLRLVSTDGSRLSWSEAAFDGQFGMGRKMLVPRKALAEVRKLIDSDDVTWQVSFGDRSATFGAPGMTLMVRLIDGEFPEYRQVIPARHERRVELSRDALTQAVRRVSIVASDRNHSVRFSFEADHVVLSAHNVDLGDAREELPAELSGTPMETGFNVKYFQDILSATQGDRVVLELGAPLDPCIVRIPGRDDVLFVVMPMRLD